MADPKHVLIFLLNMFLNDKREIENALKMKEIKAKHNKQIHRMRIRKIGWKKLLLKLHCLSLGFHLMNLTTVMMTIEPFPQRSVFSISHGLISHLWAKHLMICTEVCMRICERKNQVSPKICLCDQCTLLVNCTVSWKQTVLRPPSKMVSVRFPLEGSEIIHLECSHMGQKSIEPCSDPWQWPFVKTP